MIAEKVKIISEGGYLTKKGLYYKFSNGLKIFRNKNKEFYNKLEWNKYYNLKSLNNQEVKEV